jgi:HlyD family secretion protein
MRSLKRISGWALGLLVVAALVYAFMPGPVEVDVAPVERGALLVTVDEDGRTRLRDRYTVSAPLAGRLSRVTLRAGDAVEAGRTVLATIQPTDPALLDPRAETEARLRVEAAETVLRRSQSELTRAGAELEFAQQQLRTRRQAAALNATSQLEMEEAVLLERTRTAELRSAELGLEIAQHELALARAALLRTRRSDEPGEGWGAFEIVSPITGRVLRVMQESAGVVVPGVAIMELGDTHELEVEIDVLSRDAVGVRPGARVLLEQWGGEEALEARVRLIEPGGFTKISALGVEEQRVNVIADFDEPPPPGLGDAFRVEARIVVWEGADVLQAPLGALLRHQGRWAVYVVEDSTAKLRAVEIGRRGERSAEITSGLREGETLVVHPGEAVADGARVRVRGGRGG